MSHLFLKIFDDGRLEIFRSIDFKTFHFSLNFSGDIFKLFLTSLNLRFPLKSKEYYSITKSILLSNLLLQLLSALDPVYRYVGLTQVWLYSHASWSVAF